MFYFSPIDVLYAFFGVRTQFYGKRKLYLLDKLTNEWEKLDNRVKFIRAVIDGKLIVSNRKKADILSDLVKQGFRAFVEPIQSPGTTDDAAETESVVKH